jgi:methionyl aminopeptidase
MESYELTLNNRTIPVKAVRNITGHNILRYKIHGDKQVPFVASSSTQRMEEGDIFAIETFGTTGKGLHHASAKALLKTIDENFGTLVFARRYLERLPGVKSYQLGMKTLVNEGIMESYAPLVDVKGSYIAQFEHVSRREVLS